MPKKTAPKVRSVKTVKKPVKVASRPVSRVAARPAAVKTAKKSMSMWESYCAERDAFYKKHPNSQVLMGILILVILLYLGLYLWSQAAVFGFTM